MSVRIQFFWHRKTFSNFRFLFAGVLICTLSFLLKGQSLPDVILHEIKGRVELNINPGISVGVLHASGETQYYNFGSCSLEGKQTPDSMSLYEIGSVTKTFTSMLADKHIKEDLTLSVSEIFPTIDNPSLQNITLAQIRNHSSGLPRLSDQFSPDDWRDPFNGYTDSIFFQELLLVRPDSAPFWAYSNFGYGLLGKALEELSGISFENLINSFFKEVGMTHTYWEIPNQQNQQLLEPTKLGVSNSHWKFTGPSHYAGGLISCTRDLVRYLKYQRSNNTLFTSDTLSGLIPTPIHSLGEGQLFYKNGWFVLKPNDQNHILLHNGGTGGFTSFVAYHKESKKGVVILSNSLSLMDDVGLKILYPDFPLKQPQKTIAYDLAKQIEGGKNDGLIAYYKQLKEEGQPDNIVDIYWLERYQFGAGHYKISHQLSEIMVEALPKDWEVWDIKGQNLEQLKKYKKALAAYQKAYKLNPNNKKLLLKIERCRSKLN